MTLDDAERLLTSSPNHRVLRRIPPTRDWPFPTIERPDVRRAAFVDVETTGLDPESDEVIELAIMPFDYDALTGSVLRVRPEDGLFAYREPNIAIPPDVQAVHGITAEEVKGAAIDPDAVAAALSSVQIIVAHNAGFDRPMVEKHWPIFETKPWACSLSEIDWRAEGMGAGKLDYLLGRFGWFFDGHRAQSDAEAGVFLVMQQLPKTGARVLHRLLEHARSQTFLIRATVAPFEARGALKRRGYRWDPDDSGQGKAWWIVTAAPDLELDWLREEVFGRPIDLPVTPVTARVRHSKRELRHAG